jgi:L-amino acid N-acyltransferase YncA
VTQSFQIQSACIGDAQGIAQVNYAAWKETYRGLIQSKFLDTIDIGKYLERWENILKRNKPGEFVLVLKTGQDKVIGYCSGGRVREKLHTYESEIYALYLLQDFHGKGLGGNLFKNSVLTLKDLGYKSFCLFVLQQNPTIQFYQHYNPDFSEMDAVHIGEEDYDEVCFGWNSFNRFVNG